MLDGILTANLQIPGLRIGDELEFAVTFDERNIVYGPAAYGMLGLPPELAPGIYRLMLTWPEGKAPSWQASPDLKPAVAVTPSGLVATLEDVGKLSVPDDAPPRYSVGRTIEFSEFKDWTEVSRITAALYEKAAVLPNDADLAARIDQISEGGDPHGKAMKALALVQETIRYVFTGMDGGNYIPASAAATWDRRFGDCKGQSALLLAILRRLGIDAELVLVSTAGGDGLDARSPSPMPFDHVVLRTTIGGRRYWLDATRTGDHHLLADDEVPYRWVLPLSVGGAKLAQIAYLPPKLPKDINILDIDATAGVEQRAKVQVTRVLRGNEALLTNLALKAQTAEGARQGLMKGFADGWIKPEDASWAYDETSGAVAIKVSGSAELDWDSDEDGPMFALPGGGFYPPAKRERSEDQDQTLPYANPPGSFSCSVTRMRLPKLAKGHWESGARKIDRVVGGIAYYRQVNLTGDTISLIRSSRTQLAEISPAEAEAANSLIPGFDNNKVTVATYNGNKPVSQISDPEMPDLASVDWLVDGSPCLPESAR